MAAHSVVEATPDNLPAHVDANPDSCVCPVIVTEPGQEPRPCGAAVGWVLREVQDTYDSGYERLSLSGDCVVDGFWVVCEECGEGLSDPDHDDGWSFVAPPNPENS